MQSNTKEFLTRKDLCQLFQISLSTVIRWQESGKLPVHRFGAGSPRYKRSDVEALISAASQVASV
jgi:excisionase family DNA binding protein